MAGDERLGASFSIDTTNLKAGLATANRLIRESESEFRAAAAGMDDWTKSEEGLTKRQKALSDQIDIQKEKISALTREKQNIIDKMKAEGKSQEEIERAVDSTNKQISTESKQLDRLKGELDKTNKALDEMGNEADDAGDALQDTAEAAKESGDGFTIAKGAISDLISKGISALVGACKNAISSIANLAEETREYREDMGKLETAWESAGKSTEQATKLYKDFYSVLGEEDRSVEAVNHLAKFVDTEEDLAKWTDICTGVWGTFGDSLPIEGLTEASNETAKVGKITGVLADALNWAGVNEDDFQASLDECSNEQERQRLITDTLNGLYSEAADNYRENNSEIINARKATSDYTDSMADLGERVEPITTKVKEGFTKILDKVLELTDDVDLEGFGKKIDKAFDTFLNDILPKILDGLTWIKDHKDELIAGIVGIGTAFAVMNVANMINGLVKSFQAFKLAQEGATVAQWALNAAQNANPIGLIVAAIAGLVAAFIALWNNCDGFREFWLNLWDGIKEAAKAVADWFSETWQKISDWFSETWQKISDFFSGLWSGIQNTVDSVVSWIKENWQSMLLFLVNPLAGIFKYCYDHFEGFRDFVDGIVEKIKGFFSGLWQKIVDIFSGVKDWFDNHVIKPVKAIFEPFFKIISELAAGCWKAIQAVWSVVSTWFKEKIIDPVVKFFVDLWNNVKEKAENAWNRIKEIWQVVSTWFKENIIDPVINFFVDLWNDIKERASSAWNGIKEIWSVVSSWFNEKIVQPVSNFFSNMWGGIKGKASDAWEGIKNVFGGVTDWFHDKFSKAWQKVKDVFSTGGKVFEGIKDGIESAFKKVVNAIIRGINKVIAIPFNAINTTLDKIRDVSIAGIQPFSGLITRLTVPQIPELAKGGVVRGATTAVIGEDGAEAIVPLEKNRQWIKAVAEELAELNKQGVVVNQTNNYSGAHSRLELYKTKQQTAAAVRLAMGV